MERSRTRGTTLGFALVLTMLLSACQADPTDDAAPGASRTVTEPGAEGGETESDPEPSEVTLAFAGDLHFEQALGDLTQQPDSTLGPMSQVLSDADLAMVNLESALTDGGSPADKELEDPSLRYWFRSPPAALEVLDRSGVDVASIANNHGADFGRRGLRDSLRAAAGGPVAVVGLGRDAQQAVTPHRVSVNGTDLAVLAADASPRESDAPIWAAGERGLGLTSARGPARRALLDAVRQSDRADEVVVVYLHWGTEGDATPTAQQRSLARALSRAGADVVVGAHAHVLLGSGMMGETYVNYGLGNFQWYNGSRSETGVLQVRLVDGEVVDDDWQPGRIPPQGGQAQPLRGLAKSAAQQQWLRLRNAHDLEAPPDEAAPEELPAYASQVSRLDAALRRRMTGSSHDPASCPVPLSQLRLLRLSYVGFDGQAHEGELVVRARLAEDVVQVFEELYDARWPIRRMELVDEYAGNDDRSMAANNSSAYNCRSVAGSQNLSDHAFGRAIDLNPVQNPYVTTDGVLPPAGRPSLALRRSANAQLPAGTVRAGDVVTRAFERVGWAWGGVWSEPDYQHFYVP